MIISQMLRPISFKFLVIIIGMEQKKAIIRIFRAVFGIALLVYMFTNEKMSYWLPFYTFQTNLFIGIWYILAGVFPGNGKANFWLRDGFKGALTTYITITGVVYNLVLIPYEVAYVGYLPTSSIITHMIVPVVMIVDYLITPAVVQPQWKKLPYWLIYPLSYAAITLVNGALTGFYPYPFIDPESVGSIPRLVLNYIVLVLAHLGLAAGYLAIARNKWKRQQSSKTTVV